MKWGIWDTVDNLWVGTDDAGTGPKLFDEDTVINGRPLDARTVARLAAQIGARRAGFPPTRFVAKEWDGGPVRVKDELDVSKAPTTLEVLTRLERGTIV
jgi:hypothetical protein